MDKNKIMECLAKTLNIDLEKILKYPTYNNLEELGMTSLVFVSFIVNLESIFNISILDSDMIYEKFSSIDSILATLFKYFNPQISKKVLIVDADNVLWNGIAGEGEIIISSDILSFQNELLRLYNNGVLLCICSRNEEKNIFNVLEKNDLPLSTKHFTIIKANHSDKASNIVEISLKLNLPIESFVFIDDSMYEIAYVSITLPEITCICSANKNLKGMLSDLFFNSNSSLPNRTKLYREQMDREKIRLTTLSIAEYNKTLNTKVVCRTASLNDSERLAELSQRTNQFNLSAKHYSLEQIRKILTNKKKKIYVLSAQDCFGDLGIVGMAILSESTIEDFMISCRVFDRNFEEVLLKKIIEDVGKGLKGIINQNEKNKRFWNFYNSNKITTILSQ